MPRTRPGTPPRNHRRGTVARCARPTAGGNRDSVKGLDRAFGGALLVALPVLMTVQMWRAGVMVPA